MAVCASSLSDEELLREVQNRGLVRAVSSRSSQSSVQLERVLSPTNSLCTADIGPCLIELGSQGCGPLAPLLQTGVDRELFKLMETSGVRGSMEHRWRRVEQEGPNGQRSLCVARLKRSRETKAIHVCGPDGLERFRIQDMAASSWSPIRLSQCFQVLPSGKSTFPLFTFRRESMGKGPLGPREQWKIFTGGINKREQPETYYVIAATWGWDYQFFRRRKDFDAGMPPVAQLWQVPGTGVRDQMTQVWFPSEFNLSVGPKEDSALLLSMATVLDCVHGRSEPPGSVV